MRVKSWFCLQQVGVHSVPVNVSRAVTNGRRDAEYGCIYYPSHASVQGGDPSQADTMGKGFFISKTVGVVGVILGAAAVATIIALSVVYSQEKAKNNQVLPTDGAATSKPPTTPTPSNEPWDKYRLPKSLVPHRYSVTLWPRLTPDDTTGLYIFTGQVFVNRS